MKYPINQIFYSLQGEGAWTGTPMIFIRFAGCNINCSFCDTPDITNFEWSPEEIGQSVEDTRKFHSLPPTVPILFTGGEPTIHNLQPVIEALGYKSKIHMETNGSKTKYDWVCRQVDWLTVSPKTKTLSIAALLYANEIKFLVGPDNWEERIEMFMAEYRNYLKNARIYVMPLDTKGGIDYTPDAIRYCRKFPEFSLTLQTHKIIHIQ